MKKIVLLAVAVVGARRRPQQGQVDPARAGAVGRGHRQGQAPQLTTSAPLTGRPTRGHGAIGSAPALQAGG